jgi:hypothetical protein
MPLFRKKTRTNPGTASSVHSDDPDLAQFHRAIEIGRAQPPGDEGQYMSDADVSQNAALMKSQYEQGELEVVWKRRLAAGYNVGQGASPREDWFAFNALPALAALRLGYRDHSFVATCCGYAEQAVDYSDAAQVALVDEFKRLYFG